MRGTCAALVLTFGLAGAAYADPFRDLVATGWVWNAAEAANCEQAEVDSVSPDRKTIWVETGEQMNVRGTVTDKAQYRVLGSGPRYIDMFLELETFRDPDGRLVWWRLAFLDDGRFIWIRSDWEKGRSTRPMSPCLVLG